MLPKDLEYIALAHRRADEKKTHVSFPQLKYPSLRDEGSKHPVQWLRGKTMDDGAEGLWRIHNGIYDLSCFVKSHPGGAEWLELSKGTDITEAFECHHINPTVNKTLEQFYIREAKTPRNSPFTFNEDGFYRTLKRAVWEELKKIPSNVRRESEIIIDGLFLTCLLTSALSCWSKTYWVSMVTYLLASVSFAWVIVASHNYVHSRTNWRMYLFNICLWSYRDFRVSHALSHHLYTNTLMDLEISGFEPTVIRHPRKKPMLAKFGFVIEQLVFPFLFFANFLRRFILNFTCKGFYSQHYSWHDGIGFLLPVWIWLASGESFYNALVTWFWVLCTGSYIFYNIGTNAGHHHPKIFKDGDQVTGVTPDWGMHEIETVMDRTDINGNLFKVMTFFGDHALHHLFPALDHAVLSHLYPVFLYHCQKFRANFRVTSSLDLFIGQIKMTMRVDPTTLGD